MGSLCVLSTYLLKESPRLQEKGLSQLPQMFWKPWKKEEYLEVRNLVEILVDTGKLDSGKF